MEIWLDSIDLDLIQEASDLGLLKGVTTNPTLLSKLNLSPKEFIRNILQIHNGPIAIQIVAKDHETMINEAREIHYFHPNLIIKVPVTKVGLSVLSQLIRERIPCLGTTVFTVQQFLLTAILGCNYVAPYLGRMEESDIDAEQEITTMQTIIQQQNFKIKILAAAIRNLDQVIFCALQGIHAITLSDNLFKELLKPHYQTLKALERFDLDWKRSFASTSIMG